MTITIRKGPRAAGGGVGTSASGHGRVKRVEDVAARVHGRDATGRFYEVHVDRVGPVPLEGIVSTLQSPEPEDLPYAAMVTQTLYEESRVVKARLRAWVLKRLASDLKMDTTTLIDHLAIPRSTFHRKYRDAELLSVPESERVLGVAKLVGQVKAMLANNEDAADFDAAAWVGAWLEEPLPAIGNERPIDLMDTAAGQELVSKLLLQAQTGTYA